MLVYTEMGEEIENAVVIAGDVHECRDER